MAEVTRRAFINQMLVAGGGALMTMGALSYGPAVWATAGGIDEANWHFVKGWPRKAYDQKTTAAAMKDFFGQSDAVESKKITLNVPDIAENGGVVPITISADLPKVTRIGVFVPKNPYALTVAYRIPEGTEAYVANRIKMAKGSEVIAVVESDGKLYKTSKHVKVTVGGCGG